MDTRMYNSGCLSYRDGAFAGGVETTRALSSGGVCATQNVFQDQRCDGIGWTNFRGHWGTPHPGGATIGLADGSVTSVQVGTVITALVDIADGTVKGPPFQTHVVRIEMTLALCLCSIQRLPAASVT
jgi:prepilin-type processing-associated H-X9-DG protein